jgi:hypothetical protein
MTAFDPLAYGLLLKEAAVSLLAFGTGVWAWIRVRRAQSWPSTQGTVMSAQARTASTGRSQHWVGELAYSYVVESEYYSGFHVMKARNERRADALVYGWKGRMVVVRYSPAKHDISVLLKSDQPGGQLGN